jgi:hypothetical protein
MQAGRNDPCPCGSGKKYKKCCWTKDKDRNLPASPAAVAPPQFTESSRKLASALTQPPPPPQRVKTPEEEHADRFWAEFESLNDAGRAEFFSTNLHDPAMTEDMAFEMLAVIHGKAAEQGERKRLLDRLKTFREERPDLYAESRHSYLSWCLSDALAERRLDVVPWLATEFASDAGDHIDVLNRVVEALEYYGTQPVLIELLRSAWPSVKSSKEIFGWAIAEFAERGIAYETLEYLERTSSPDPADPVLLDRVRYFVDDPDVSALRELVDDLTGRSDRVWQTDEFNLLSPKRPRDSWDDDDEAKPQPDPGAENLGRLLQEFVGYLRRVEGVPYSRGELIRHELYCYFLRRNDGELDPRPSLLEQVANRHRKLPKPPKPAHPLCPERVTFDAHLGGLLGMFNLRFYVVAALFETTPAWLRFLQTKGLIGSDTHKRVIEELIPLHETLQKMWEKHLDDPTLFQNGQSWVANAAIEPRQ